MVRARILGNVADIKSKRTHRTKVAPSDVELPHDEGYLVFEDWLLLRKLVFGGAEVIELDGFL